MKLLTGVAALRVFAPGEWTCDETSGNNGLLFEGTRLLGPVPLGLSRQKAVGFAPPSGWGGQLAVRCRRFNDRDAPVVIAKAAADFGVLSPLELTDLGEDRIRLKFGNRLTVTEDTRVHLWDETGRVTTREAGEIEVVSSREWRVPLWADQRERACIVAVSFKGVRLGARSINLSRALPRFGVPAANEDADRSAAPIETAAWLRWLRLPLLREDLFPSVTEWLNGAGGGAPAVYAWVRGLGLPNGFSLDTSAEEGWRSALRRLLKGWSPSGAQASQLFSLLYPAPTLPSGARRVVVDQRDAPMRIGRALAELADACPDMAGAALRAYWRDCLSAHQRDAKRAAIIEGAVRADWEARFLALIQSENDKKRPKDRQENPSVNDANLLTALASAFGLPDTFLAWVLAASPSPSWSRTQCDLWRADRDAVMETGGELRALAFLRRFNSDWSA